MALKAGRVGIRQELVDSEGYLRSGGGGEIPEVLQKIVRLPLNGSFPSGATSGTGFDGFYDAIDESNLVLVRGEISIGTGTLTVIEFPLQAAMTQNLGDPEMWLTSREGKIYHFTLSDDDAVSYEVLN